LIALCCTIIYRETQQPSRDVQDENRPVSVRSNGLPTTWYPIKESSPSNPNVAWKVSFGTLSEEKPSPRSPLREKVFFTGVRVYKLGIQGEVLGHRANRWAPQTVKGGKIWFRVIKAARSGLASTTMAHVGLP